MLSVILLILKIIGIALLVLLGMVLFLLLIVLFVPIRYRVKVEHGDAFTLECGLSWLLHFIHARISQSASSRRIWVRIMGILVYDSSRAPKDRKIKNVKRQAKDATTSKDVVKDDLTQERAYSKDHVKDVIYEEKSVNDEIQNNDIQKDDKKQDDIKFVGKLIRSYRNIKAKIKSFFIGVKTKIKEFLQKLFNIKDKTRLILNFLNDDINKKGFRFTYDTLKKILKHILPKKVRSKLIFGTGDPCSTGQALGIFGILYGIYGDNIQLTPDFESKVFKGSHYVKGRIRIWTLLIIIIKLLLDKRFKDLKMNYQLLKEAL